MRIGEESNVENHVGVDRNAVFESERFDRHVESFTPTGLEDVEQTRLQLVHVEIGGVDHEVAIGFDGLEKTTFRVDRLEQSVRLDGQAMPAPRGLVATHQLRGGGVEIDDAHSVSGGSKTGHFGHEFEVLATGDESELVDRRRRLTGQFDDGVDEGGRQVVDHVPPEILEHGGGGASTRAGHAGDQENVSHRRSRYSCGRPSDRHRFSLRRYNRRGIVAAASYSAARARKPGGGAGSSIPVRTNPCRTRVLT